MKFFADESIESEVVKRLRQEHHELLHVPEIQPGLPDEDVLAQAREAQAILLTHDKDFGALVFQKKYLSTGIVLCRLQDLKAARKADLIVEMIRTYSNELSGAFAVLTENEFRIRKL